MPLVPKGQDPYWVPEVLQCCSPLPSGTLGEFNQPPTLGLVSWVLLGMGTHAGVNNDREKPPLTFTTFIEYHHHIISSLHIYTYRLTHLAYTGSQVDTSVWNNKNSKLK